MIGYGMISNGSKLVILPTEEFENYYIGKNQLCNKYYEENDTLYVLKNDCTKININDTDYLVCLYYDIFMYKRFRNRLTNETEKINCGLKIKGVF